MQSVLGFEIGGSSFSKIFQIYSANPYGVEFFRKEHEGLSGTLSEDSIGYRLLFDVEFKPLNANKQDAYWMAMFMRGKNREITVDATTYSVTVVEDDLQFNFFDQTYFANAFTLHFVQTGITYITDTGSTRILKPQYTASGQGISGETLSIMVNLYDDSSIQAIKYNLTFINENKSDIAYAYRHLIDIDFGYIKDFAYRTWLIEFALWGHKQIDGTAIDSLNGKVYDVIFGDNKLLFPFAGGKKDALICRTIFKEKTPHTDFEEYTLPPTPVPVWDEVVFDDVVTN